MGNAFDLRSAVAHGVKRFFAAGEVAVRRDAATARLAEVDIACQLADDENVQAADQLSLKARGIDQLRVADGRAKVGEQAKVFAQAQNGLLRAQRAIQLVVLPVADSPEQNCI